MPATSSYRPWRTALGLFLPLSLGLGFFVAGIGTTMSAPVTSWAAGAFCSGTVIDGSDYYTTPSGGSGVHRHIICVTGEGKNETRDDITFDGIAIAFPLYSALFFVGLLIFAAPRMRRNAEARPASFDVGTFTTTEGDVPPDLQGVMGMVAAAMQQGNVTVHNVTIDSQPDDTPAARLAALKQLHDGGLISDADFEAKKAEILSGL
ncbi:SHOCT domain-containing protein [Sphingomonas bacterium]|uniref:SHOCT domain-containing protein n=1 Tax=Sphingomonas bacterium TaxID=1895847 RepID=UPI002619E541|nr:SHOCT domain-containing protein [Sphingomonas bacterium]MDB5677278.1 hypothetical protein [Sphingomonas bacterium]